MKLIVGLGNPGKEYENTRHNIGFMVVDNIAKKMNVQLNEKKFNGIFYKDADFILAKPLTYMNNSGDFVQAIMQFFQINPNDILVIQDDLDIDLGKATIRQKGSAGGHNGIKSIIEKIGTNEFKRLKIGIGRGSDNVINYVLSKFTFADTEILSKIIEASSEAAISFLFNDINFVINKFNGKF